VNKWIAIPRLVRLKEKRERVTMPVLSSLFVFLKVGLALSFSVTFAAIYGSPFSWLERYLGIFATRGTDSGMHFSSLIAVATKATL
jgi:hypothetical protein